MGLYFSKVLIFEIIDEKYRSYKYTVMNLPSNIYDTYKVIKNDKNPLFFKDEIGFCQMS